MCFEIKKPQNPGSTIVRLIDSRLAVLAGGRSAFAVPKPQLNLHRQVGDLLMTQPLAVLNVEELHWLGDLGLPNQRRWLNHRTLGDEHRRTYPSAATDSSIFRPQKGTKVTKHKYKLIQISFVIFVPFVAKAFVASLR